MVIRMEKGTKGIGDMIDGKEKVGGNSMRVRFWRDDRVVETAFIEGEKILDLLKRLNMRPDGVLVMSSGTPLPLDEPVPVGSELTIIDVRSGG